MLLTVMIKSNFSLPFLRFLLHQQGCKWHSDKMVTIERKNFKLKLLLLQIFRTNYMVISYGYESFIRHISCAKPDVRPSNFSHCIYSLGSNSFRFILKVFRLGCFLLSSSSFELISLWFHLPSKSYFFEYVFLWGCPHLSLHSCDFVFLFSEC